MGYRDPMLGLLVLVALIFMVALVHYFWRNFASKSQERGLEGFIKKFDFEDEHKDLLRTPALSPENLHFLASIFTKSGEFEKAIQIYLIALEKTHDKDEQELVFVDLAELYFKAGFLQKSAEVLLNALNLRPRNEKALKLLKIVYLRLKKYDEVLQSLDALFELGFEVRQERTFIELMKIINLNLNSPNLAQKIEPKLYENNDFAKRYLLERSILKAHAKFELVLDLLYKQKEAIFLDDDAYFELFCAMNLTQKRENYIFKNQKLKMLEILNEAKFPTKLKFSYVCKHCKNQMPIFFYHCPLCYEFGGCEINYEVKCEEM